jgi:hypothetical protein
VQAVPCGYYAVYLYLKVYGTDCRSATDTRASLEYDCILLLGRPVGRILESTPPATVGLRTCFALLTSEGVGTFAY